MLQNYKKDFKPYFTGLRQDNNKLKEFFNTDSFILEVREQAKKKIARNLVDYKAGKTILDTAMGIMTKQDTNQTELW